MSLSILLTGLVFGILFGAVAGLLWFEFQYGEFLQHASWRKKGRS